MRFSNSIIVEGSSRKINLVWFLNKHAKYNEHGLPLLCRVTYDRKTTVFKAKNVPVRLKEIKEEHNTVLNKESQKIFSHFEEKHYLGETKSIIEAYRFDETTKRVNDLKEVCSELQKALLNGANPKSALNAFIQTYKNVFKLH